MTSVHDDLMAAADAVVRAPAALEHNAAFRQTQQQVSAVVGTMPTALSLEEAMPKLAVLAKQARNHGDAAKLWRFAVGALARRIKEAAPHGSAATERVAKAVGLHVNTVRECMRLAAVYHDDVHAFGRWLRVGDYAKDWVHVQALIRSGIDPTVLGPAATSERLLRRTERAADDLERSTNLTPDSADEAAGVALRLTEAAAVAREQGLDAAVAAVHDAATATPHAYTVFLQALPCVVTGHPPKSEVVAIGQGPLALLPMAPQVATAYRERGATVLARYGTRTAMDYLGEVLHLWACGQPILPDPR